MKRFFRRLALLLIALYLIGLYFLWESSALIRTDIEYKSARVPAAFNGFAIVQISDLHNKLFGEGQHELLAMTQSADPDIIVITGDLIDRSHTDIRAALTYVEGARKIAPVFYVAGNHEAGSDDYGELAAGLKELNAVMLNNDLTYLTQGGEKIALLGIADPNFFYGLGVGHNVAFAQTLQSLAARSGDAPRILLSHRPELIELYAQSGVDLAFCGHAHGGQVRLPFIGPLYAPNQGFFPKYTAGLYTLGGLSMVVSRGLGNSAMPIRVFNRPEVVVVTLCHSDT